MENACVAYPQITDSVITSPLPQRPLRPPVEVLCDTYLCARMCSVRMREYILQVYMHVTVHFQTIKNYHDVQVFVKETASNLDLDAQTKPLRHAADQLYCH